MASRSEAVTIGIIKENPGSKDGIIVVLDELHKNVPFPRGRQEKPDGVPDHGDCLSVWSTLKAKRTRAGMATPSERLDGFWRVPGEFHRRMLLNQDTMNALYKPESVNDRGTLYEIKAKFQIKSVKSNVNDCFNHVEDMLNMVTKGFVCLTALELLDMKHDTASTIPDEQLQVYIIILKILKPDDIKF